MPKCEICGNKFGRIQWSHLKKHNVTIDEYKELFPKAEFVSKKLRLEQSKLMREQSNPNWRGYYAGKRNLMYGLKEKDSPEKVRCAVCGKELKRITQLHLRTHGIKNEKEYKIIFPNAELFSVETRRKIAESVSKIIARGEKNPNWRGGRYKECEICGKRFWVKPSADKSRKTCSGECARVYKGRHYSGRNHPCWKGGKVTVGCEICGKGFQVVQARAKAARFCSEECFGEWQSTAQLEKNNTNWKGGGITLECDICGKKFKRKPADVRKHNLCSNRCQRIWRLNWRKENGPTWPEPYYCEKLGHNVRSSWEEEIGLLLKENGIDYLGYEVKTFEFGGRSYTPDYIIDDKRVLEVKGYLTNKDFKRYQKFTEAYPELTFIIVGGPKRCEELCDIHIPWKERERLVETLSR